MMLETSFIRRSSLLLVGIALLACTSGTDTSPPTFLEVEGATGAAAGPRALQVSQVFQAFRADPAELTVTREHRDEQGDVHTRYAQFKNGLKVLGGELIVHRRAGAGIGSIYAANGSARADLEAPAAPALSPSQAIASALAERPGLEAEHDAPLAYRLSDRGDALALVYQVTVTGTADDGLPIRDTVLVNAADGTIVDTIARIQTAKYRQVHNCANRVPPCPIARAEGQPPAPDPVVNANYDVLGHVYDAYKNLFGRDSFDGAGAKLVSTVRYPGSSDFLVFWGSTHIVYGNGDGIQFSNPAYSLDLTGHEITHGVIERTSNLTYSGQPGALNESLGDIFGAVIEWYGQGKVVSAGTWQFAEDIYTPHRAGDALRYLNDPKKDDYSLDFYPDYYNGVDIHYASGISNLAFYLLSQGGKHPRGKSTTVVTGIGIEKAARVFYRANDVYFTSNTTFAQAKKAIAFAAAELGYTPAEIASVNDAWTAVGVP
ncbi:M4 family metallopeptidase [Pendulispora albinea]|uniref:Neutral metalloproteinase n=1 Tax=Pendulispora albinea TaxID=2741071 RepID=A0ABZ2MC45_9BACT